MADVKALAEQLVSLTVKGLALPGVIRHLPTVMFLPEMTNNWFALILENEPYMSISDS